MRPSQRPRGPRWTCVGCGATWLALASLAALVPTLLGGCRGVAPGRLLVRGGAHASALPERYADDARVTELLAGWQDRVSEAQETVALMTGLEVEGTETDAVLAPLGDESRAYELRTLVREGRRTPQLRVNLERLAAGVERPETVLRRGLALALLELAVLRSGNALPPWFLETAACAAAGDLAQRLEQLVRDDVLAQRPIEARLDPEDPRRAPATGLAALLLLLERGGPDLVRRFLGAGADGDEPVEALKRLAREPQSPWPAARMALESRLDQVEAEPYRALARAERALAETGRAGLLAELPSEGADVVRDELLVLSARAAMAEGDVDAARAALRALAPDAPSRLRDPLEALTLRLRAEAAPGGDPALAARLLGELESDFPRRGQSDRLRVELRVPEAPGQALAALRRRAAQEGLATLDLESVVRLLDLLANDQRYGAAQRVLDELGERTDAAELRASAQRVAAAQREPPPEALEAARARVDAWQTSGTAAARGDVVDGGTASARVLAQRIGSWRGGSRAAAVRLLGEVQGGEAVALLAEDWVSLPPLLPLDVEALAGSVRPLELEVWVRTGAAEALAAHDAERLFATVRLDLAEPWVRVNPDVPRDLRSADFTKRRAALARAVEEGEAARAPELIGRLLRDVSPLLRREGVTLATQAGFEASVRAMLEDASPLVRSAAALALARLASDPATCQALARALRADGSARVRTAAAAAACEACPRDPALARALAEALADEDPGVRQAALEALRTLPADVGLAAALARLEEEAALREPRGHVLTPLFGLLEPHAGQAAGYYPGMPLPELRRAVTRVRARLDAPRRHPGR